MSTFYVDSSEEVFRFGDVVRGFAYSAPILAEPLLNDNDSPYNIEVCTSPYAVVLSPCCSIDKGMIALARLQGIIPAFYQNPWLIEDLTRINRKMPAGKSVPPHVWADMPQSIKEREFDLENDDYAFGDMFIYEQHQSLPRYVVNVPRVGPKETGYYMIDFTTAYRVKCDKLQRNCKHPIEARILQLSNESRSDLRNKIAAYFARIPKEERV